MLWTVGGGGEGVLELGGQRVVPSREKPVGFFCHSRVEQQRPAGLR